MELYGTILRFFQDGGIFMFPIAATAAFGLAVTVERWLYLNRTIAKNASLWHRVAPQLLDGNLDGADRSAAVADSLHLKSPTLVDAQQAVARTYDVAKLPLTLLLDAEGHVRVSWSGVPADFAELTPQLERLRQD